ncbi:MAG: hypothetical protein HQ495_12075 [Alphaproteobacteria bacterium]|nr:hypothetical protein [Alphaproteobacteria bacterium]
MPRTIFSAFILAALLAASVGPFAAPSAAGDIKAAHPQPDSAVVKPGLSVKYYIDRFNHIDEVINAATWMKPVRGEPLPMLNYNVGAGPVLTNKNDDLVGAFIQGYIKIDKPGTYLFSVQHNDGVRVWVGNEMIYDAPFVAPDTWSPNLEVVANEAGWYPLRMIYYEKKSTATLELYWQAPGAASFEFVPAAAFGHIPGEDDKTS